MPDTKPTVIFNQVIGTPGTFEPGMDMIIFFESKLTNFFLENGIENETQKKATSTAVFFNLLKKL